MSGKLRFKTFGGAAVVGEDGVPMGGAAAQRRLLALLALTSVADAGCVTRDKALALLWPEGEPDRVRHALSQTLYHLRATLRCEDLFVNGEDIRLNPLRITSDVAEFQAAIAAGDRERAVDLYAGPFLEGFHLRGSSEFEFWVSTQRDRLAKVALRALDQLAVAAEACGEWLHAAEWRRRQVAIDPLSSQATAMLMTALANAGDPASALREARTHIALLREQLEMEPDAAVTLLVERLRAPMQPVAEPPGPRANAPTELNIIGTSRASIASRPRRWKLAALASLVTAAAVAAVVGLRVGPPKALRGAALADARQEIVVAPFRVRGADQSLSYLREGMVELLGVVLEDDSLARAIDPGATLAAWRRFGSMSGDLSDADIRSRAKALGAGGVVVGSVVGSAAHLVITASLLGTGADDPLRATGTAEGPADSLASLVDRLAATLLTARSGEADHFPRRLTSPLGAVRAFVRGQAAYRRGDYVAAVSAYDAALRVDSGFAIAAFQLALAANAINDAEQHDRALSIAWARRDELTERDRAHLVAFAGPQYPSLSSESDQLSAWDRAVRLSPDRADVWYEFGERLFHQGDIMALPDAHRRAADAFRHAMELDPADHAGARGLLLLASAREGDTALVRRFASPAALRDSLGVLAPFLRWRVAYALGDLKAQRQAQSAMPGYSDANLRAIAMSSLYDAVGVEDGSRAARLWAARPTGAAAQLDAFLAQHALALNAGQMTLALDLTEQVEEQFPGSRAGLRLRVLDALYSHGDSLEAARAADRLAQYADAAPPADGEARAQQLADVCVVAQWRLSRGDTRQAPAAMLRLWAADLPRAPGTPVAVGGNPRACSQLLGVWLAVDTHQRDAAQRVAAFDSLILNGPAVKDIVTYAHLVVAQLYTRLGQPQRALDAIRRRGYMTGWPRYLATARLQEARLASSTGDVGGAKNATKAYLDVRKATFVSGPASRSRVRSRPLTTKNAGIKSP